MTAAFLSQGRPPRKLSVELAELQTRAGDRAVPLPGLSTPLGLAIVLIALRLSLGQRPWLPMKIQRAKLPAGFFGRLATVTARLLRFLESVLQPRWPMLTGSSRLNQLHAAVILLAALVLLLPLPIPLSNLLPAWAIFLLACGLLERDGLFVLLGYVAFTLTILYFVLLGNVAQDAVEHGWAWLRAKV